MDPSKEELEPAKSAKRVAQALTGECNDGDASELLESEEARKKLAELKRKLADERESPNDGDQD